MGDAEIVLAMGFFILFILIFFQSVIKTIESSWYVMISQLLVELRSDLSLTKCLQLVGFLRRMQAFTLTELKMKFLQERGLWFEGLLAKIPKTDAYQQQMKIVEITRVSLFNIITQYKALFEDDDDGEKNSHLIINGWVQEKLDGFLRTLELGLLGSNMNMNDILAITNQCMYFGSSFSRIGYDFRAQVSPIFIKAVSKCMKTTILEVTTQFETDMEAFTLINRDMKPSDRKCEEISNRHPPESILNFYPLAAYLNNLLIFFNAYEQNCIPLAIAEDFMSSLNASLQTASKALLKFFKNESQAFSKKEQENYLRLCSCFCYEFIPYIQFCINQIFQKQNFSPLNGSSIENFFELSKAPLDKLLHLGSSGN